MSIQRNIGNELICMVSITAIFNNFKLPRLNTKEFNGNYKDCINRFYYTAYFYFWKILILKIGRKLLVTFDKNKTNCFFPYQNTYEPTLCNSC